MRALVAVGFGLLYAYDVWEAVSTLLQLPLFYERARHPGLVRAVVAADRQHRRAAGRVRAGAAARPRQEAGQFALILLVGLAVVAALALGAVALEFVLRPPAFIL